MRRLSLLLTLAIAVFSSSLMASPQITVSNGSESRVFDRNELEAFPQTTIITTSPYFDGEVEFSGPTLARLVETLGLSGHSKIVLKALNNYEVGADLEELLSLDAIVATRRESKTMSVRDRGPFWIMLPLSERPELNKEDYHRFMVWQLSGIELK